MAQKSNKFGEIIKKTIAFEENELNQTSPRHPSPHLPSQMTSIFRGFSTWWAQTRRIETPKWPAVQDGKNQGGGRGDLRFDIAH